MSNSKHRDPLYEIEEKNPDLVDGEYMVSVRDNDEARLILGFQLGIELSHEDVARKCQFMRQEAIGRKASAATVYRIESCGRRLAFYDPLVF